MSFIAHRCGTCGWLEGHARKGCPASEGPSEVIVTRLIEGGAVVAKIEKPGSTYRGFGLGMKLCDCESCVALHEETGGNVALHVGGAA